jgi:regulatory protein YycI of two-component signal transduction system YycFG
MNVSFDFNFWTVLLFLMDFGLAVFVSISNRSKAANDELKKMKDELESEIKASKKSISDRLEQHGERLARIESDIENSIGDDDIKAVHRRVDELSASSNEMKGQLSMIIDGLKDIQKLMLSGGFAHGRQ